MHEGDLIHPNHDLHEKLQQIYALRRTRSKVNWDRDHFLRLLSDFGNPHLSLPPVIHVAGTNGKGSVIAMMRSIYEAQGYKVHVYTSPHLIRVNERIVLAGEQISDDYLSDLIDQALVYADDKPLSFFEMMTAIAFKAFSNVPADIVLLEVGMGGRLDCTNVIENPIACVINRISMDHTDFLGDTIEKIALEKAGIMKADVPCFCGKQDVEVTPVLVRHATCVGAELIDDWGIDDCDDHVQFHYGNDSITLPFPSLSGEHQVQNAGLALATIYGVRKVFSVSKDALAQGLDKIDWPGRLQKLDSSAFDVSDWCEIFLDCGHNDSAGEALAAHFSGYKNRVYMILGMLKTKNIERFLRPMRPVVEEIYLISLKDDESYSATDVEGAIVCHDVFEMVRMIHEKDEKACILIAGSAYLAGDVLGYIACTMTSD